MRISPANILKIWFLANTLLWPFYLNIASMHFGLNLLVIFSACTIWLFLKNKINQYSILLIGSLAFLFCMSFVVLYLGPCVDKYDKFFITAPVLLTLIYFGIELGRASRLEDWQSFDSTAIFVLCLTFLGLIFEMINPEFFPDNLRYQGHFSYSGIFPEPSAVAFSVFPAIAVLICSASKKSRIFGVTSLIGLFLLSRSTTLIGLTFAWILYDLLFHNRQAKLRSILLIFAFSLIAMLKGFYEYTAPSVERLFGIFSNSTSNLSSLVYLQGLQDMVENLVRTNGFGLGINMMGCNPLPDVSIRQLLLSNEVLSLNSEDGSFLASKILSEIGLLGIFFYSSIIFFWYKSENLNKGVKSGNQSTFLRIPKVLIFLFLVLSVLRSTGYFSGSFLLMVPAIAALSKMRKRFI